MVELAERFDFALETLQEADLLGELGGEYFEGGLLSGEFFLSKINASHAAAAEFLEDDPFSQTIADHAADTVLNSEPTCRYRIILLHTKRRYLPLAASRSGETMRARDRKRGGHEHENGALADRPRQPQCGRERGPICVGRGHSPGGAIRHRGGVVSGNRRTDDRRGGTCLREAGRRACDPVAVLLVRGRACAARFAGTTRSIGGGICDSRIRAGGTAGPASVAASGRDGASGTRRTGDSEVIARVDRFPRRRAPGRCSRKGTRWRPRWTFILVSPTPIAP